MNELKFDDIQEIVAQSLQTSALGGGLKPQIFFALAKLYKFLLAESPTTISLLVLRELFKIVPRLPATFHHTFEDAKYEKFEPAKHWSPDSEGILLLVLGIINHICNMEENKTASLTVQILCEHVDLWIPIAFYAPETCSKFITKLHQAYNRCEEKIEEHATLIILKALNTLLSFTTMSSIKITILRWIETIYLVNKKRVHFHDRMTELIMPNLINLGTLRLEI